ncbi:hypothetical protein SAMN05421823_101398 [Catalinimonas alkaloidigena]|uniref:Uncharacterized protein n=1 Tax=Catalinimonas alkaloidigena TaxID=1075417 RepID=A0A1G8XKI5_9BACT|nr:hypothetical protein [Catalinimonas alkaloidigena]SDJ91078.1 hypothetical protein SAMN05421823_101398 [Catalinimonas alkaloidigena]
MEVFVEFLKILLPAAVVLYGMYLTVQSFLSKETEKRLIEIRSRNTETIIPVRLQAYERICLFLERISPHNLVLRVNNPAYNALQLQQRMVADIREEYNHNLSQQVYMSDEAWLFVKNAMEEVIGLINTAASEIEKEAPAVELAKHIFEKIVSRQEDPTSRALHFVKDEIRQIF